MDVRFVAPNGEICRIRKRAPVPTKSAAQRWGEALERDMLLRLIRPEKQGAPRRRKEVPTLQEFAPRFIEGYAKANRQKPSGIAGKEQVLRTHLLPKLGRRRLDAIHNEDIQRIKADLAVKSPKTVNNVLTCLSKLLKVAIEWDTVREMPCRIKLLKVSRIAARFLDFGDYERLIEGAAKVDARAHVMVLLGGDAGLRRGEIIGLCQEDVDFTRRILTVRRSVWHGIETLPKSGRPRLVNMTEALTEALQGSRHLRGKRVLYADDGELTAKVVQRWMERAVKRAGLPITGGVHILRHTFCGHLAMRGAPAKAIQELAGHEDLSTTLGYMHLSPSARRSAIDLLDKGRTKHGQAASRGDIVETGAEG